jgi:hypothetical protein
MRGIFSMHLILPVALGPRLHSASNRNEYQKQKNNVSGGVQCGRCVGLATLPPFVSRIILNISQPYRPPRPFTRIALLFFTIYTIGIDIPGACVCIRKESIKQFIEKQIIFKEKDYVKQKGFEIKGYI